VCLLHGASTSKATCGSRLEYAFKRVQENYVSSRLNGTDQFLVYADNVYLLGENINTVKEDTEALIEAIIEVGLEVNTEKTKYMLTCLYQNVR
jgi:hypothetical protein